MQELLKGVCIIDFTGRLPGPFGGMLLANLGARVIKVEDTTFKDPFIEGLFPSIDPSFKEIYNEFNQNKEVLRLDFKSESIKEKIDALLKEADGVMLALPPKLKIKFGLDEKTLSQREKPIALVELKASVENKQNLHDLNALAITGLLKKHASHYSEQDIVPPPFLPISGMSFGAKAALSMVSAILKTKMQNQSVCSSAYLLEATDEFLAPFWPKSMRENSLRFLHNGKYPCYSIYRLKDNSYVALAAVEEKFWLRFCELFKLDLNANERFYHDDLRVFEKLAKTFQNYNKAQIEDIIEGQEICLSLV